MLGYLSFTVLFFVSLFPGSILGPELAAIVAMTLTILIYDELLFRRLVAWADKFRFEHSRPNSAPKLATRSVPSDALAAAPG